MKPPNTKRTVIFPLGVSTSKTTTIWEQAAQLTVSGIQFGLMIALGALGLSIIYGTTGLTNFAHGEIVTFGALATWTLNAGMGLPFVLAAILGLLLSAAFGWLNNAALWKPLRKRGTGLIAMMIVSIGLALFLRNFYLFFFGGDKQAYREYSGMAGLEFGPVSITPDRPRLDGSGPGRDRRGGARRPADPDGQGHPRRLGQPEPRLERRHQRRAGHHLRLGAWARRWPDSAASCSASPSRCPSRWASRSCC